MAWPIRRVFRVIWVAFTLATLVALPLTIWEFTHAGFNIKLQAWFIGGIFVILSFPVSLYEIVLHTEYYAVPKLQRHIIRILWMVPIYGVDAWFALRFQAAREYLDPIRECYEAFVIYNFYAFLMNYFEMVVGDVPAHMAKKPPMRHLPVFRWFLRPWEMGAPFLFQIKKGILNYVIIRPVCSALALATDMIGLYGQGVIDPRKSYVYLAATMNFSQLWALYCLVQLYHKSHTELAPIRPLSKFLVVKAVVFISFWQGVVLAILVHTGVIYKDTWTYSDRRNMAASIQDFLICIEMFFAALAHAYAFPPRDYMEAGYHSEGFFVNVRHMFDLRDVVDDVSVVVQSHARSASKHSKWAAQRAAKAAKSAPGHFISILTHGSFHGSSAGEKAGGSGTRGNGGSGGSLEDAGAMAALLSVDERALAHADEEAAAGSGQSGALLPPWLLPQQAPLLLPPPPLLQQQHMPWAVYSAGSVAGLGGRAGKPLGKAASEPSNMSVVGGGGSGGGGGARGMAGGGAGSDPVGASFVRRSNSESEGLSLVASRLFRGGRRRSSDGDGGGGGHGRLPAASAAPGQPWAALEPEHEMSRFAGSQPLPSRLGEDQPLLAPPSIASRRDAADPPSRV